MLSCPPPNSTSPKNFFFLLKWAKNDAGKISPCWVLWTTRFLGVAFLLCHVVKASPTTFFRVCSGRLRVIFCETSSGRSRSVWAHSSRPRWRGIGLWIFVVWESFQYLVSLPHWWQTTFTKPSLMNIAGCSNHIGCECSAHLQVSLCEHDWWPSRLVWRSAGSLPQWGGARTNALLYEVSLLDAHTYLHTSVLDLSPFKVRPLPPS